MMHPVRAGQVPALILWQAACSTGILFVITDFKRVITKVEIRAQNP
jgi:hypothetical protein